MQMIEFNMVSKSDFEKFQSAVYHSFEKINERFEKIDERKDAQKTVLSRLYQRVQSN